MCGIAGFIVLDDSRKLDREKLLDELLLAIDNRGGDATGYVARNNSGDVEWHKASCKAATFNYYRRGMPYNASACLAHTRFATSGLPAFPENNHPLKRGSVYLVHNGVLSNEGELFKLAGREPFGQVDSEALAAVLSHAGSFEGKAVTPALEAVRGSAAIAALDETTGDVLLARIDSSPLYVLKTRRLVVFASTEHAVRVAHERAIGSLGRARPEALDEGTAILVREGKLTRYRFATPPRTFTRWSDPSQSSELNGATCYLPSREKAFDGWEGAFEHDGALTPAVTIGKRCELCEGPGAYPVPDGYGATWNLCEDCEGVIGDEDSDPSFSFHRLPGDVGL